MEGDSSEPVEVGDLRRVGVINEATCVVPTSSGPYGESGMEPPGRDGSFDGET